MEGIKQIPLFYNSCYIDPILMMTLSNGNIFRVAGPLCGEFPGHRWIPFTKASDAKLRCFLWSAPQQTVEQTMGTPVIWDDYYDVTVVLLKVYSTDIQFSGEMGGYMGLLLGASVLTLCEILDLLLYNLFLKCMDHTHRSKATSVKSHSSPIDNTVYATW